MYKNIEALTEDIEHTKIAVQYIYKLLNKAKLTHTEEESEDINEPPTVYNNIINGNPTQEINCTAEKAPISEKEFNYKMAAHDLIGPLSTQYTLLDVIKEECFDLIEKLKNILQTVTSVSISNSESIKRSKAVLNSNNQQNNNHPIVFRQLVDSIVQLLGIQELYTDIDVNINIHTKKDFYSNTAMVQSIIQNLVQNAVKYSKPNGKNSITITLNDTNNGVEIIIQDTGIGMEKQRVNQLFNQVVDSHVGTTNSHGFGLYGVAQYVEKLNGKITAESTLHIGSTFRVQLPSLGVTKNV